MADEEEVNIDGKPISTLRVVDLRKECDKRGLSKSGSKVQLIDRLKADIAFENLKSPNANSDAARTKELDEVSEENEFIRMYLQQQKQLIQKVESQRHSSSQESDADESPQKVKPVEEKQSADTVKSPPAELVKTPPPVPPQPIEPSEPKVLPEEKAPLPVETTQDQQIPEENSGTQLSKPTVEAASEPPVSEKVKIEDVGKKETKSTEESQTEDDSKVKELEKVEEEESKEKEQDIEKTERVAAPEPADMGRSRRRLSRPEKEDASQENDMSAANKPERESRRTRNSKSLDTEKNDTEEKTKSEIVGTKGEEKENKDNDEEKSVEKNKEKDKGTVAESSETTEEKMEVEPEVQKKEDKPEEEAKVNESEEKVRKESEQAANISKKVNGKADEMPRKEEKMETEALPNKESQKDRGRKRSSSSSSSSSSKSRSRQKKKNTRSSSSSSSRSRSRSPVDKKKKLLPIVRKKARASSSSSSRSRSRSPSPKRVKTRLPKQRSKSPPPAKRNRSASRSSSSRSRSASPADPKKEEVKADKNPPSKIKQSDSKETDKKETKTDKAESVADKKEDKQKEKPQTKTSTQPEQRFSRKISLNRRPIETTGETEDGEKDKQTDEKPMKKRKWGSRSASTSATQKPKKVTSMPISTDSLKDIMPDIKSTALKLAPEPILEDEMDYEDDTTGLEQQPEAQEDTRSVKIQRTVVQEVKDNPDSPSGSDVQSEKEEEEEGDEEKTKSSEEEEEEEEEENQEQEEEQGEDETNTVEKDGVKEEKVKSEPKVKEEKKEEKTFKTIKVTTNTKTDKKSGEIKVIRRLDSDPGVKALVKPDEPEKPRRSPSPARNPISKIVHIRNLVRPFTVNQLKELAKRSGPIVDEEFWIDKIKSHCFIIYENEDDAVATRKALHNTRWPQSNPKTLIVDFGSEEQLEYYKGDEKPIPPPEKKAKDQQREKERLERQEKLKEEREREIARRKEEREKRMKEREEREKQKPVREWDRQKKSREDWDRTMQRSKSRSRSRSPKRRSRRSRSRSLSEAQRKSLERMEKLKKQKAAEKKDDEPPAKLLDDLFRKTKTTPCIYWLPLTEEQAIAKEKAGIERPTLRLRSGPGGEQFSPIREGIIAEPLKASLSPPRRRKSPKIVGCMKPEVVVRWSGGHEEVTRDRGKVQDGRRAAEKKRERTESDSRGNRRR